MYPSKQSFSSNPLPEKVLLSFSYFLCAFREEPVVFFEGATQSDSWWGSSWLQAAKNKVILNYPILLYAAWLKHIKMFVNLEIIFFFYIVS